MQRNMGLKYLFNGSKKDHDESKYNKKINTIKMTTLKVSSDVGNIVIEFKIQTLKDVT